MLATSGWDLVADNILFVPEAQLGSLDLTNLRGFGDDRFSLELADFVLGNISKRGAPRGELGFLKPVIRREFFERHQLAYREEMRLGEDFELYARMLALGARFTVTRACGYVAVERADSLSARHSVRDLARMADAEQELLKTIPISTAAADALRRHHAQLARKVKHGTFLARKREAGVIAAAWGARSEPRTLFEVAYSVAGDKLAGARQRWVETENAEARARFLLPPG
jgi:succinoglycan biosynthesis protein ExoU